LTVFQCPDFFFWIFTGTVSAHAAKPSFTVTLPRATRVSLRCMEMFRSCDAPVTVKLVGLVTVPPGVVTLMGPVVAPAGTVVTICVAVFVVIDAVVPLNVTEVAPAKFVPVMVTGVPTRPDVGVNDVMVGLAQLPPTVKVPALCAEVPLGFVTVSVPLTAPVGTAARTCVAASTMTVV
jgi:hypothetical protein